MSTASQVLLVFAREPVPGQVKTRLIPAVGAEQATQIYQRLLRHALDAASRMEDGDVQLWCDTLDGGLHCLSLSDEFHFPLLQQSGADLGERMSVAIDQALRTHECVVIIGSDCPGYSQEYIQQAFNALSNHDVVLGPADDGGYVLIGMNRPQPELFLAMPWGTDQVLAITRERLQKLDRTWFEMPVLRDVDRPDDLIFYKDFFRGFDEKLD